MARPKEIDAAEVFELAAEGFKVVEIAQIFNCHADTISNRFSAELRKGKLELKKSLRRAQIQAAKMHNSTMLVWLGKQYLGQSDTTIDEYILEAIKTAGLTKEDLLELIKNRDLILNKETPKRTFAEFCAQADYFSPFQKQIEMYEFGFKEEVTRLLLGARGVGKTDYITILGTAYDIYLDPNRATNLIMTKSKDRNAAIIKEIEIACEKNGVKFDKASSTRLRAEGLHGKDPSVSAVTIKTVSLRGRHPKRVIMDDPVTEDDTAEAARLTAKKKYNEAMKLTSNILIIGQPAHQYDLYAELRDIVKKMEVPHGSIPELDHDLEAQRLAGVDEASISASYHLKILSEGTNPFDKVRYIPTFPKQDSVAFIDPSEGVDYTAVTILTMVAQAVHAVGFVYKKQWNHCLDDLVPKLEKFGVKKVAFETNKHGPQAVEMLQQLFKGRIGVIGWPSSTNKHARILAAGSYSHMIQLSKESDRLYLDHVVKYEYKSKFDDAPDSLACCMQWVGLIKGRN